MHTFREGHKGSVDPVTQLGTLVHFKCFRLLLSDVNCYRCAFLRLLLVVYQSHAQYYWLTCQFITTQHTAKQVSFPKHQSVYLPNIIFFVNFFHITTGNISDEKLLYITYRGLTSANYILFESCQSIGLIPKLKEEEKKGLAWVVCTFASSWWPPYLYLHTLVKPNIDTEGYMVRTFISAECGMIAVIQWLL